MTIGIDYGTYWVCQCCMLDAANGECCADDSHGGDGVAPWALLDFARFRTGLGMSSDEHGDECEVRITGEWPTNYECDCETREFSHSSCEGCGTSLAGSRYAAHVWRVQQHFPRRTVALP